MPVSILTTKQTPHALVGMSTLELHLSHPRSSIAKSLDGLRVAIEDSLVHRPKYSHRFVFLCGANKKKNEVDEVSERRRALIEFALKKLPHNKFFVAEKVFSFLSKEGHKGNLIDVENQISEFSDHILIVLESNSTFAELGAFSHKKLRKKLIVINDKEYEKEKSFVNLGPIKAIEEVSGKSNILHYKMEPW